MRGFVCVLVCVCVCLCESLCARHGHGHRRRTRCVYFMIFLMKFNQRQKIFITSQNMKPGAFLMFSFFYFIFAMPFQNLNIFNILFCFFIQSLSIETKTWHSYLHIVFVEADCLLLCKSVGSFLLGMGWKQCDQKEQTNDLNVKYYVDKERIGLVSRLDTFGKGENTKYVWFFSLSNAAKSFRIYFEHSSVEHWKLYLIFCLGWKIKQLFFCYWEKIMISFTRIHFSIRERA